MATTNDVRAMMVTQEDATDLVGRLADGTLTSAALTARCMRKIAELDGGLNAFCALNDEAIRDAEASDARRASGAPLSAIDGLPVAIKDNLVVAGLPCTWGSRLFADYVPDIDELPVERLRAAGAILIGKTNVPEFTLEGYTDNDLHGVTRNPWDLELTPGGSSGGSVAAVAAGMVPCAIGTDGGGSIRRPAGFTGLVGLKPSIGTIARGKGLPQLLLDFEVVGPICRSVRDAALLMEVLSGPDSRDHRSRWVRSHQPPVRHLRILCVETIGGAPVDPSITSAARAFARVMESLGHAVRFGSLPFDTTPMDACWPIIGKWGLAALRAQREHFDRDAHGKYVTIAKEGAALKSYDLLQCLETIEALRNEVGKFFDTADLILTPTSAAMPWPAQQAYPGTIAGQPVGPRGHAIFTGWVNACGHPAIALPAPVTEGTLPVGVQLIADFGGEQSLLSIGQQYETAAAAAFRCPISE